MENLEASTSSSNSRKRKSFGRLSEASKKLKTMSHELGEDCSCKKMCSREFSSSEKLKIISNFNQLKDWNEQSSHLTGLISTGNIQRRRPRKDESEANLRDYTFHYKVRVIRNDSMIEVPVCQKAFLSLHGITKKRLETIRNSLKLKGIAPVDRRGKHGNIAHKLPREVENSICAHIASFQGRPSHYSIKKTKKMYLPEELSIVKMYKMFLEMYPNTVASYETYRKIFNTRFNISFGFPRCDTCSTCDKFSIISKGLETQLKNATNEEDRLRLKQELRRENTENEVHRRKADTFYERKRQARDRSRKHKNTEAICMDFQRNLPCPNISTSVVYYKRQLSLFLFNIHRLSDNAAVFYAYPETIGKKGSNEVASFLHHYVTTLLDPEVKHLEIFCDSCGGQNKNYTLFRYMHYLVHQLKRFDSIHVTFPVRGHSYLESDKDMGLIKTKLRAELPRDWMNIIKDARVKPSPFDVVEVDDAMIRDWTDFLQSRYRRKCPFPSRIIKEMKVDRGHPRYITHRDTYNWGWTTTVVTNPTRHQVQEPPLAAGEFMYPSSCYEGELFYVSLLFKKLLLLCCKFIFWSHHAYTKCIYLFLQDCYLSPKKSTVICRN